MDCLSQFLFEAFLSKTSLIGSIENSLFTENTMCILNAIGWMLLHSLWQLVAIALVFLIGRQLIRWSSPQSQKRVSELTYSFSVVCLVVMIAAPIVTLIFGGNGRVAGAEMVMSIESKAKQLLAIPESLRPASNDEAVTLGEAMIADSIALPLAPSSVRASLISDSIFAWVVIAWLIGMILFSLRPILGLRNAKRLSTIQRHELPVSILKIANRVASLIGVSTVEFASSALVEVPTVVGYFRPVVLLPASALTGLSTHHLEQIIAHELGHVRRHDYLVNLLQTMIETVLFFHPAVWWLSNQVRVERENCCDDIAISHFGDSKSFVEALFSLEQTRTVAPPSLAANGGSLVRRARRLLGQPAGSSSGAGSFAAASVSTLILTIGLTLFINGKETVAQNSNLANSTPGIFVERSTELGESAFASSRIQSQEDKPSGRILAVVNGQNIYQSKIADDCLRRHGKVVLKRMINRQLLEAEGELRLVKVSLQDIDAEIEIRAKKFGMTQQQYVDLICSKRHISRYHLKNDIIGLGMLAKRLSTDVSAQGITNLFNDLESNAQIIYVYGNETLSSQMPDIAAIVNDQKITMEALQRQCLLRFGEKMVKSMVNQTLLTQALKKAQLQVEKADIEVEIARAAKRSGFINDNGSADVPKWIEFVTLGETTNVDSYVEDEVWPTVALAKLVAEEIKVTDQDLQQSFEANYGARVTALAIVLNDHRTALKIWNLVVANPTDQNFEELAAAYSREPASKKNRGLIPPIARHRGQPELEKAAFALKENEVSPVVQVGKQWIILRCQGRTEVTAEFDNVKGELITKVREKKLLQAMEKMHEALTTAAQIEVRTDMLFKEKPKNEFE